MNNKSVNKIQKLIIFLLTLLPIVLMFQNVVYAIPMFQARSGLYVSNGTGRITGNTDVNAANRFASGVQFRDNIVNEKSREMRNNYTAPGTSIPALFNNDMAGEWTTTITPNVDPIVVVWETRNGLNAWTGNTWVAGYKKVITQAEVTQSYKSMNIFVMEPIPTPTFQSATSTSITINWTGLWDNNQGNATGTQNDSITGYTLYRSVNGGSYTLLSSSIAQSVGSNITFTDNTVSAGNTYKYHLGVKFSWTASALGYYESQGKGPDSADMLTVIPDADRVVILGSGSTIVAGNKTAVKTLETRDSSGNARAVNADTTITLTSNSTGSNKKFYSVSAGSCTSTEITTLLISSGTSQNQFCYYDEKTSAAGWTITATKTLPASPSWLTGTQNVIVTPAALENFIVSIATPQKNRVTFTGSNTVTAYDSYNNIKTDFNAATNNVTISSTPVLTIKGLSGGSTNLLSLVGDFTNGVASLTGKLSVQTSSVGAYTFTATSSDSKVGTSGNVTISAGVLDHFSFGLTSNQIIDTAFTGTNTLTVLDIDSNVITNFDASTTNVTLTESLAAGTVSGLGSGLNGILNQAGDFVNGVSNLANKIKYVGTAAGHAFKATAGAVNTTSGSVTFTHGVLSNFLLTIATPQINDQVFTSASITARDKGNNVVTDFNASSNNVTLTADTGALTVSGGSALLSAANSFTNGVSTLDGLLKFTGTKGTRTITATSADSKTGNTTVLINSGGTTSIKINNASGQGGTEVTTSNLTTDSTLTLWAAAYDVSSNFINNVSVTWASGGTLDSVNVTGVTNISFAPTTAPTTGTISITDSVNTDATGTITVNAGAAKTFIISAPTNANAGIQFNLISVTAKDSHGNTATGYTSSKTLTLTNPANGVDAGTPTASLSCTFNNGIMTTCASITLVKAETVKLKLTDGVATGQSNDVIVDGGIATHLHINAPTPVTAGVEFNITSIYAHDAYGNLSTLYSGGKTINYSGPANGPTSGTPQYTHSVSFSNGTATTALLTTLFKRENIALTITDGSISGVSSSLNVLAGSANNMSTPLGNNQTGTIGSNLPLPISVVIKDLYGNLKDGYNVNFAITNGGGSVGQTSVTTDTNGKAQTSFRLGSSVGTNNNVAQASVSGLTGSPIDFTASAGASTVSGIQVSAPSNVTAGNEFDVTITAVDNGGNTTLNYSGLKNISLSGANPSVKGNNPSYSTSVTFTNGVAVAKVTFYKNESLVIHANISGDNFSNDSGSVQVNPNEPATFEVIAPASVLVNSEFNLSSIKTLDAYGNYATNYSGSKTITYSGPGNGNSGEVPTYTTNVEFTNGNATTALVTKLFKAESINLNVTDTNANISGNSNTITVTFEADYVLYYISGNNQDGVVGQPLANNVIVMVLDKFGNAATSKTVNFAPNKGSVNNTNVIVASNGQASVIWTLGTTLGNQSLVASVAGVSSTITFNANAVSDVATNLTIAPNSLQVRKNRASTPLTLCLNDQYGNLVTTNLDRTINLNAVSETGSFSSSVSGPWNSTSIQILNGQSCVQLYYQNAIKGSDTLTFSSNQLSNAQTTVTIQDALISRITLSPATFSLSTNQTQQLTASAYNDLDELVGDVVFTWEITSSNAGAVTQSGLYYPAKTVGTYNNAVRVSYNGISAYANVTVTQGDSNNNNNNNNSGGGTTQVVYVPTTQQSNPVTIVINKNYTGNTVGVSDVNLNVGDNPVILSPKNNNDLSGNKIITVSGTAPANKVIVLEDIKGNALGSSTSDKNGYWKIQIPIQKFSIFGDVVLNARILNTNLTSNYVVINIKDRTLIEKFIDLLY